MALNDKALAILADAKSIDSTFLVYGHTGKTARSATFFSGALDWSTAVDLVDHSPDVFFSVIEDERQTVDQYAATGA